MGCTLIGALLWKLVGDRESGIRTARKRCPCQTGTTNHTKLICCKCVVPQQYCFFSTEKCF